jgi:hypothetical protein
LRKADQALYVSKAEGQDRVSTAAGTRVLMAEKLCKSCFSCRDGGSVISEATLTFCHPRQFRLCGVRKKDRWRIIEVVLLNRTRVTGARPTDLVILTMIANRR